MSCKEFEKLLYISCYMLLSKFVDISTKQLLQKLGGGVPRDAEFYRIENRRLMEQKDAYMQQNEELNRDFIKASDERNKFEQELESSRKLVRELRAEVSCLFVSFFCQFCTETSYDDNYNMRKKIRVRNKTVCIERCIAW